MICIPSHLRTQLIYASPEQATEKMSEYVAAHPCLLRGLWHPAGHSAAAVHSKFPPHQSLIYATHRKSQTMSTIAFQDSAGIYQRLKGSIY